MIEDFEKTAEHLANTVIAQELLNCAINDTFMRKEAISSKVRSALLGGGLGAVGGGLAGWLSADEKRKARRRALIGALLGGVTGGTLGYGFGGVPKEKLTASAVADLEQAHKIKQEAARLEAKGIKLDAEQAAAVEAANAIEAEFASKLPKSQNVMPEETKNNNPLYGANWQPTEPNLASRALISGVAGSQLVPSFSVGRALGGAIAERPTNASILRDLRRLGSPVPGRLSRFLGYSNSIDQILNAAENPIVDMIQTKGTGGKSKSKGGKSKSKGGRIGESLGTEIGQPKYTLPRAMERQKLLDLSTITEKNVRAAAKAWAAEQIQAKKPHQKLTKADKKIIDEAAKAAIDRFKLVKPVTPVPKPKGKWRAFQTNRKVQGARNATSDLLLRKRLATTGLTSEQALKRIGIAKGKARKPLGKRIGYGTGGVLGLMSLWPQIKYLAETNPSGA